ncbi:MAG: phosphotransferase [Gemmatimonadota bacterium]
MAIEPGLLEAAEGFLGSSLRSVVELEGGYESLVFRAEGESGPLVLHVSPPWRTRAELAWVHTVVRRAHERVPQAVQPIECGSETIFGWQDRLVTLFPYIEGETLNREDPKLRDEAGRVLASIHVALLNWTGGPRPDSGPGRPTLPAGPPALEDHDLDRWWESVVDIGLATGATHGDYYRGNLLCRAGRISGVVDWHDAALGPLVLELAGATFEFCKNDDHILQADRAREFLRAYLNAGGPVPDHELEMLVPFIRWWVRRDARWSLACTGGSQSAYARKQIEAFADLAHVRIDLR